MEPIIEEDRLSISTSRTSRALLEPAEMLLGPICGTSEDTAGARDQDIVVEGAVQDASFEDGKPSAIIAPDIILDNTEMLSEDIISHRKPSDSSFQSTFSDDDFLQTPGAGPSTSKPKSDSQLSVATSGADSVSSAIASVAAFPTPPETLPSPASSIKFVLHTPKHSINSISSLTSGYNTPTLTTPRSTSAMSDHTIQAGGGIHRSRVSMDAYPIRTSSVSGQYSPVNGTSRVSSPVEATSIQSILRAQLDRTPIAGPSTINRSAVTPSFQGRALSFTNNDNYTSGDEDEIVTPSGSSLRSTDHTLRSTPGVIGLGEGWAGGPQPRARKARWWQRREEQEVEDDPLALWAEPRSSPGKSGSPLKQVWNRSRRAFGSTSALVRSRSTNTTPKRSPTTINRAKGWWSRSVLNLNRAGEEDDGSPHTPPQIDRSDGNTLLAFWKRNKSTGTLSDNLSTPNLNSSRSRNLPASPSMPNLGGKESRKGKRRETIHERRVRVMPRPIPPRTASLSPMLNSSPVFSSSHYQTFPSQMGGQGWRPMSLVAAGRPQTPFIPELDEQRTTPPLDSTLSLTRQSTFGEYRGRGLEEELGERSQKTSHHVNSGLETAAEVDSPAPLSPRKQSRRRLSGFKHALHQFTGSFRSFKPHSRDSSINTLSTEGVESSLTESSTSRSSASATTYDTSGYSITQSAVEVVLSNPRPQTPLASQNVKSRPHSWFRTRSTSASRDWLKRLSRLTEESEDRPRPVSIETKQTRRQSTGSLDMLGSAPRPKPRPTAMRSSPRMGMGVGHKSTSALLDMKFDDSRMDLDDILDPTKRGVIVRRLSNKSKSREAALASTASALLGYRRGSEPGDIQPFADRIIQLPRSRGSPNTIESSNILTPVTPATAMFFPGSAPSISPSSQWSPTLPKSLPVPPRPMGSSSTPRIRQNTLFVNSPTIAQTQEILMPGSPTMSSGGFGSNRFAWNSRPVLGPVIGTTSPVSNNSSNSGLSVYHSVKGSSMAEWADTFGLPAVKTPVSDEDSGYEEALEDIVVTTATKSSISNHQRQGSYVSLSAIPMTRTVHVHST